MTASALPLADFAATLNAWSTFAMAILTFVLAGGVFVAASQLRQDRLFNRTLVTTDLLKEWNKKRLWECRNFIDRFPSAERNRVRANRVYRLIERNEAQFARAHKFIEDTAQLAERMLIFVRKKAIDEAVLFEDIGYEIVATYYGLQDVLAQRALQEDFTYEGFRKLAVRVQTYGKRHPEIDLPTELVVAEFPIPVVGSDQPSIEISPALLRERP